MGLSFYGEKSMEETVGSLRFRSYDENPISETGDQEGMDPISTQQDDRDQITLQ